MRQIVNMLCVSWYINSNKIQEIKRMKNELNSTVENQQIFSSNHHLRLKMSRGSGYERPPKTR